MKTLLPHLELFTNSSDGMFMFAGDSFIDCNDAVIKILGYNTKEELLRRHPSEISPPFQPDGRPSREKAEEIIQSVLKHGNKRFHWVHTRADGSEFWAEISLTLIHLEEKPVIYCVLRDIHQEKMGQIELAAAKRQFEEIVTNFPVAIVRAETDNINVGYFNNRFHELFGWDLQDISTMDRWFIKAYPDTAYRERIVGEWDALIKKTHALGLNTSPYPMEARVTCKNGKVKICQAWYHWNGGNVFGIFHDITAQREAEANLLEAHDELMRKNLELKELNTSLDQRVKDEVAKQREQEQLLIQQAKMAAMGEMIGAIAHQWRQPLNVIALNIQDIQDAYAYNELDKEYLDNMVKKSMQVVNYMSQTIDDFRNFFKPDKQKVGFNVIKVVDEAINILETQFKNHSIMIETDYQCGECLIDGYPTEVKQLLLNLLNNSKDAIIQHRKKTSNAESGHIMINVSDTDEGIKLSIQDNGGGIPVPIMDKIFDPYFTTKEQGEGTGLGLYMSKIIIDKHMQGTIRAENVPGGVCFVVLFKRFGEKPL